VSGPRPGRPDLKVEEKVFPKKSQNQRSHLSREERFSRKEVGDIGSRKGDVNSKGILDHREGTQF